MESCAHKMAQRRVHKQPSQSLKRLPVEFPLVFAGGSLNVKAKQSLQKEVKTSPCEAESLSHHVLSV